MGGVLRWCFYAMWIFLTTQWVEGNTKITNNLSRLKIVRRRCSVEVGGHLEFTDGGEEPRAVRPQPAVLLTEPKLHSEEVTLEQTGGH